MENQLEQSVQSKIQKDFTQNDTISLRQRIFTYYCNVIRKNEISTPITSLLIILETFQIMSYAFTSPLLSFWNLSSSQQTYIRNIIGAPRITPLYKYISFNIYLIIYIII